MLMNAVEQGNKLIGGGSDALGKLDLNQLGESLQNATPDGDETTAKAEEALGTSLIPGGGGPQLGQRSFGTVLKSALQNVNEMQVDANRQAELLATGQATNPHEAVVAMEKAHLALQLTASVVEKAVGAYKQISQMQV